MSKRKLNIEDKKYNYYIKEYTSDSESSNLNVYTNILSNKSFFYITNQNHSNFIKIAPSSLKQILIKGQLEPNEQILFSYYKDILPGKHYTTEKEEYNINKDNHHKNKLRSVKNEKEKRKDEDIILNIKNLENNKININENNYLKNENNYGSESELEFLNNKTNDYLPINNKYLISFYYNKIKITNDNFKCFYLSLFFCGLIYFLYVLDVLIDKNKSIKFFYNFFSFQMSILLISTGLYGYFLINKKIYNNKICKYMTCSSIIVPFISFILARISSDENIRKNILISICLNLITLFFASICFYILNELQKKNNKKGLLFEKMNIV